MVDTYHLRQRRRKNVTITELPYDVFHNILLRLPVRSLICCLCVSKQWQSIIKSPIFANVHLKRQNNHKLLLLCSYEPCTFSTFDCETLEVGPCRPVPFEVTKGNVWFKSSCNGLVLVTLMKDKYDHMLSDLILWNPLTGDYKTLTKPKYYKEFYSGKGKVYNLYGGTGNVFEIYYNSSEEDYRILRISYCRNVYIYSLKSDMWRRIKLKDAFQSLPNLFPDYWCAGTCWNENLYFYIYGNKSVRFDTKTEKFTEIETLLIQNQTDSGITVQRGCMYLWTQYRIQSHSVSNQCIMLMKMNEDGHWEKVLTYTRNPYRSHPFLQPLHLMRDGNWLMKSRSNCCEIYKVDLENKHNEGEPRSYKLYGIDRGKYIETFVSPNRYAN